MISKSVYHPPVYPEFPDFENIRPGMVMVSNRLVLRHELPTDAASSVLQEQPSLPEYRCEGSATFQGNGDFLLPDS